MTRKDKECKNCASSEVDLFEHPCKECLTAEKHLPQWQPARRRKIAVWVAVDKCDGCACAFHFQPTKRKHANGGEFFYGSGIKVYRGPQKRPTPFGTIKPGECRRVVVEV